MKKTFSLILKYLAYVWVGIVAILVLFSYGFTLITQGFGALSELASPHNYMNMIAIAVSLAPAALFMWLSKKLHNPENSEGYTPKF
jgi:TM2 domain-containing membrane protein YozV